VMNLEELRSVFERVHRSLLPHGRFLFDLNQRRGSSPAGMDRSSGTLRTTTPSSPAEPTTRRTRSGASP
jgi:hypothetical protein